MNDTMTVTIPSLDQHLGLHSSEVRISDRCPRCGGPRGEPFEGLSYDGSRRLVVHRWNNPCGHVDTYGAVRAELRLEAEGFGTRQPVSYS